MANHGDNALAGRLRNSAFAFRGYNIANLRSPPEVGGVVAPEGKGRIAQPACQGVIAVVGHRQTLSVSRHPGREPILLRKSGRRQSGQPILILPALWLLFWLG